MVLRLRSCFYSDPASYPSAHEEQSNLPEGGLLCSWSPVVTKEMGSQQQHSGGQTVDRYSGALLTLMSPDWWVVSRVFQGPRKALRSKTILSLSPGERSSYLALHLKTPTLLSYGYAIPHFGAKRTCPPGACAPSSRPHFGYLGSQYSQPIWPQTCLQCHCRPSSWSVFLRVVYSTYVGQSIVFVGACVEFIYVC